MQRENNLLGVAYNWENDARPASFDDFRRRHLTLPGNQLAQITSEYLRQASLSAAAGAGSLRVGGSGAGVAGEAGAAAAQAVVVDDEAAVGGAGLGAAGASGARSLLSKVEPLGVDREAIEVRACRTVLSRMWGLGLSE